MSKKKNANTTIQEVKKSKNSNKENGGIIVLNEGSKGQVEEELDILGTMGETIEVNNDTSYLDEELGISDIFKENGIQLMQVGKSKHNEYVEDEEEDDENLVEKIAHIFSMVLKHKKYEPIPYPFSSQSEFESVFEKSLELIDHMAIAKFSRKNPELNLRDAFNYVFTVNEEMIDSNVAKSAIANINAEDDEDEVADVVVEVSADEEEVEAPKEVEVSLDEIIKARITSIVTTVNERIAEAMEEIIKNGEKSAEEVCEVVLQVSENIAKTNLGKLIKLVTGRDMTDIIKSEINGTNDDMDGVEERFREMIYKNEKYIESIKNTFLDTEMEDSKFIDELVKILTLVSEDEAKEKLKKAAEQAERKPAVTHFTNFIYGVFGVSSPLSTN